MADLPPYSASGYDANSPASMKAMDSASSVKLSIQSSRSRTTLVDHNISLQSDVKEWSRLDHLLAVFCINRRPKPMKTVSETRADPEHHEAHLDRSPWVLPVYVLSRELDEYRHFVPREAKCTIDTGNLQGNIVSKAFLVNVLGYSEADLCKLTKDEEDGGTGITGHPLIPTGAIHLTWYHANSIRVFRDMRFLISEHPMYDLIIGARTIRTYNILDVPNLMAGPGGRDIPKKSIPMPDYLNQLKNAKKALWGEYNKIEEQKQEEQVQEGVSSETKEATKAASKSTEEKYNEAKKKFEEELEKYCRERVNEAKTNGLVKLKGKKQDLPKDIQSDIQGFKKLFKDETGRDLPDKEKPE